jgi:hypothetical protein
MGKLTVKQELFIEAYLRLQNGGKAYKEVYDKDGKMSTKVAYEGAHENLRKSKIQEAIERRQKEIEASNPVCSVEDLCLGWSDDIRFDIGDLFNDDGTPKKPKELPRKVRRLLHGLKVSADGTTIEYKLPDRQKAKIELGKRIGFYPVEKSELLVNHGVAPLTPEHDAMAQKLLDEWFARRGNGSSS